MNYRAAKPTETELTMTRICSSITVTDLVLLGLGPSVAYAASQTLDKIKETGEITFGYRAVTGGLLGEWASRSSAATHASRHGRRSDAQDWLTRQPAIIITLK